jgi:nondiscriminating glutamyl-tRNA synthetase
LILGKDRSKLSKRHGSTAVREFKRNGVLPEAFANYLTLLGSSYGEGREIMAIEDIIKDFSLERIGKSGAVFDEEKLDWMNTAYIRKLDVRELTEQLIPFMYEAWLNPDTHDQEWLEAVVESLQGNLTRLSDIGREAVIFYDEHFRVSEEALSCLQTEGAKQVLVALRESLLNARYPEEDIYAFAIERIRKQTGLKGKNLFMPIRAAVTGTVEGPELNLVFEILGRSSLLMRVEKALVALEKFSAT